MTAWEFCLSHTTGSPCAGLIARFDFTCLVAELVNIPGADEHFNSYFLFVGRAHCGSVLLPKARFALKLDGENQHRKP